MNRSQVVSELDAVGAALVAAAGVLGGVQFVLWLLVGLAVLAVVAAFVLRPRLERRRQAIVACILLGYISIALAGAVSMQRATNGLTSGPLASAGPDAVAVTTTLVDDPVRNRFSTTAIARVRSLAPSPTQPDAIGPGGRSARRSVLVVASGVAASRLALLEAGDTVVLIGHIHPLSAREHRYWWRHAAARLSASDLVAVRPADSPLAVAARSTRHLVTRGISRVPDPSRGLLAGLLIGDRRDLSPKLTSDFRAAGLSHLLAVSGENVAFVLVLVGPVLRRLPMGGRLVVGTIVLGVFGAATRWEPSVLRAIAMAVITLVAAAAGRPARTLRVLSLAVAVLLVADPFLIHSVGFQLSCGACAGIAVLGPTLRARIPGRPWARDTLAITAAAQIGVAPVLLPVFGSLPLVALPANLLAAPAVGPITILGLAGAALSGIAGRIGPGVQAALIAPAAILTSYVAAVASVAARLPVALTPRGAAALIALGCGAGAFVRTLRTRRPTRQRASGLRAAAVELVPGAAGALANTLAPGDQHTRN